MNAKLPVDPFDPELCIGTVTEIGPSTALAQFPEANRRSTPMNSRRTVGGKVGEFVIIELEDVAVFGRVIAARLAEEHAGHPENGSSSGYRSVATIQMLSTITLQDGRIEGGLPCYPWIGCRVYATTPHLIAWIAEATVQGSRDEPPLLMRLGTMPGAGALAVRTAPERLF